MDNSMMQFYKAALQGAITDPLCAEYKNEWRACGDDKERLMRLGLRQQSLPYVITHCYQGKGLSKEYILENFGDYINGNHTILNADLVNGYTYSLYVDFNGICKPDNDVTAFMWCSCPQVNISTAKCPIFYVGAGSEVSFLCDGYNSIHIYLFDDSKVIIDDADETCGIVVYRYSDKAEVEFGKYCLTKNIKIFDKTLKL